MFGYVSYAHGYKSGGLNMSGLPLDAQNRPTLLDGRATLNLAAYRTEVDDYQANVVSSLETAAIRSYPANIPQVRVQGVEADLAALLFDGFVLRASGAFADGAHADYRDGPCPLEVQTATTVACSLSGSRLAGLSRWSGTLGFDYTRPLGAGKLVVHADASFRSGYNSDTSGSRYTQIAGYGLTNARIGYHVGRWEFDLAHAALRRRWLIRKGTVIRGRITGFNGY